LLTYFFFYKREKRDESGKKSGRRRFKYLGEVLGIGLRLGAQLLQELGDG